MSGRSAATSCDHPQYPQYREQYGEDPARILYHMDPLPRVRGLDSVGLVRAYLDVETDREDPRGDVVAALNRRQRELEATDATAGGAVATDGGERRCQ